MSLCIWMICRNEARDLPRALRSIRGLADHIVVVDTGSTDDTVDVVMRETAGIPLTLEVYTGASEFVDGQWRLTNFAMARNHAIVLAEATGCDYWLWMDADDELAEQKPIRQAMTTGADAFACWVEDGGSRWIHHRLFRSGKGVHFKGRCHEYPVLNGLTVQSCDAVFRHDGTPHGSETSNERNRRLLLLEWIDGPNERTAFYLGNTFRDAKDWDNAIIWYRKRIAFGSGHREEWLFAQWYLACCLRLAQRWDECEQTLKLALQEQPDWAEFWVEWAMLAYDQGFYRTAISRALRAPTNPPPTYLWRQESAYKDQPLRLVSWCYEHLGELGPAFDYAIRAADAIGKADAEWTERILRLAKLPFTMNAVAINRPGAIGDIMMALNLVPALKQKAETVYLFCNSAIGIPLEPLIKAAGVTAIVDSSLWQDWAPKFQHAHNLVGYIVNGEYERPLKQHLIRHFARECGLTVDGIPRLTLLKPARPKVADRYVTLQRHAGWSAYKEWIDERWDAVAAFLEARGYTVVEIGAEHGRTLMESVTLIANADLHLGVDSFGQHAARLYGVKSVIVWGSSQNDGTGYPENVNLVAGVSCQPCFAETAPHSIHLGNPCRYKVQGTHRCAWLIGVDRVVWELEQLLPVTA